MNEVSSVAVFCGSRPGHDPAYAAAARDLGWGLAAAGIRLVYGGGKNGLMGELADAMLGDGGQVHGIIPEFLMGWEVAHPGLTTLEITRDMHSRKRRMAEEADAFVTLPGGIGTLDETIEILSWRQLRLHTRPVYIVDIAGFATHFLAAIEASITQGFASEGVRDFFTVVSGVPELLERLEKDPRGSGLEAART